MASSPHASVVLGASSSSPDHNKNNNIEHRQQLRTEVRSMLAELANDRRSVNNRVANISGELVTSGSYSGGDLGFSRSGPDLSAQHQPPSAMAVSTDERLQIVKERLAVVEDVLAKSEADRSAVYSKLQSVEQQLVAANDEKTALMHDLHDGHHQAAQQETLHLLQLEREESAQLRMEINTLRQQRAVDEEKMSDLQSALKKVKKENKRILAETDGVSIADLHYSNERLSAQLAKLQAEHKKEKSATEDSRVSSLEQQLSSMTTELSSVENTVTTMQRAHEAERLRLNEALDRQFKEFTIERQECDRIIGALGAKVEALMNENAVMKGKVAMLTKSVRR